MAAFQKLRRPLFFIAFGLIACATLIELGSGILLPEVPPSNLAGLIEKQASDFDVDIDELSSDLEKFNQSQDPPGIGIQYLGLLDLLLLFSVGLICAALIIPERVQGRIQGIITLIVSFLVLLKAIDWFFEALVLFFLMVGLFTSAPFGTLAYLAAYGFFNTGGAGLILTLTMALKLGFAICLLLAHQRFMQNKGLVLITLTSFLGAIIVGFLHGMFPVFLVSITDAVAAIILAVVAALWAIAYLVGSLVSIVKAVA